MPNFEWAFGPSFDPQEEQLPLAFLAVPKNIPDRSLVKMAADRSFIGNYAHLAHLNLIPVGSFNPTLEDEAELNTGPLSQAPFARFSSEHTLDLRYLCSGVPFSGYSNFFGAFDQTVTLAGPRFSLPLVHSPIRIEGIEVDETDQWRVLFRPGIVWRKATLLNSEPSGSWLLRAGFTPGQTLFFIYTIPEASYGLISAQSGNDYQGISARTFGASGVRLHYHIEKVTASSPNEAILTHGPLLSIEKCLVNDTLISSGRYDGSLEDDLYADLEPRARRLTFKRTFAPKDKIEIHYYTPKDTYSFGGFFLPSGGYYSLDMNPEEGHWLRDPETGNYIATREAITKGIQFYLLPSAAISIAGNVLLLASSGLGLKEERFSDANFTTSIATATATSLAFTFETSGLGGGMPVSGYSLRWSGYLEALYSEDYSFGMFITRGTTGRLYIDNQKLIDQAGDSRYYFFHSELIAGRKYPITLEYIHGANNQRKFFNLTWKSKSQASDYIKKPQLYTLDQGIQFPTALGSATITFKSALAYGESSFLRYKRGSLSDEVIGPDVINLDSGESPSATYGNAQFDVDHYIDDSQSLEGSWIGYYPSAIPLGKIMGAPPLSVDSVTIADIRSRGGGLPERIESFYLQAASGQLERVATFWDLGLWDGPPVKEGGAVKFEIPESVLDRYSAQEIREIIKKRIPPGIQPFIQYYEDEP